MYFLYILIISTPKCEYVKKKLLRQRKGDIFFSAHCQQKRAAGNFETNFMQGFFLVGFRCGSRNTSVIPLTVTRARHVTTPGVNKSGIGMGTTPRGLRRSHSSARSWKSWSVNRGRTFSTRADRTRRSTAPMSKHRPLFFLSRLAYHL